LYLLGKFRLPHDSPLEKISVSRLFFAIFSLMFTIYLIPGLWGAPLKAISGFTPPMFYSESPEGFGGSATAVVASGTGEMVPEGADPAHCPHGLNCFHDFETGKAYAEKVGKPIMLDFTGWGCVNCRKMEEQVWSDPRVLERLRNEVVLISLYVDERERLPKVEQYTSDITGKKVKTIGNLWSEFQAKHYQTNSQPYYVIIDHESMNPLIEPTAYDPDIPKFVDWLDRGVAAFK
jgi:thiol:disulfide interchange protein DsbD